MKKAAIGIDLGGTNIRVAAVAESGDVLIQKQEATERDKGQPFVINDKILRLIGEVQDAFQAEHGNQFTMLGVGIGAPGIIDLEKGSLVRMPQFPDWKDVPIRDLIKKRFPDLQVMIDNDATSAAWGEKIFGVCKPFRDFVYLTLGTGVGGGLVINNQLVHGKTGMAGELGHVNVCPTSRVQCGCGNYGCVETFSSASGLKKHLELAYKEGAEKVLLPDGSPLEINAFDPRPLFEAAQAGDPLAIELYAQMGSRLGQVVAILVNALNPEAICFYGGLAGNWEAFEPAMMKTARAQAWAEMLDACQILRSNLGGNSGIYGAASLLFDGA